MESVPVELQDIMIKNLIKMLGECIVTEEEEKTGTVIQQIRPEVKRYKLHKVFHVENPIAWIEFECLDFFERSHISCRYAFVLDRVTVPILKDFDQRYYGTNIVEFILSWDYEKTVRAFSHPHVKWKGVLEHELITESDYYPKIRVRRNQLHHLHFVAEEGATGRYPHITLHLLPLKHFHETFEKAKLSFFFPFDPTNLGVSTMRKWMEPFQQLEKQYPKYFSYQEST